MWCAEVIEGKKVVNAERNTSAKLFSNVHQYLRFPLWCIVQNNL